MPPPIMRTGICVSLDMVGNFLGERHNFGNGRELGGQILVLVLKCSYG